MELTFPLILDGATGTQLQQRGYDSKICAEQWVLEHPEAIIDIQSKYVAAGSNVVYSPTFGANRVKLEENKLFDVTADYNTRLLALSRQAVDGKAWVAGDIAPTGKFLPPMGDTPFEELVEIYTEQAAALEKAGADLFVIETTMTVPEARAAVLAVKSVSRKPVFVTFTCNERGKTLTGTDVVAALEILQGMGVDAFGLNCSVGPEDMLTQIRRLSEIAEVPLIAKPNAGLPEVVDGKTVYRSDPREFASLVPQLAEAGVGIFGSCCGSGPDHVAALKAAAEQVPFRAPRPAKTGLLPLATEKELFLLPVDTRIGTPILCSEDLIDDIEEACDSDAPVIAIRIDSADRLEDFADSQYAITKPLCLLCEDAEVLEQALRLYQGRAMYEGSLSEEVLKPLSLKYGLVY